MARSNPLQSLAWLSSGRSLRLRTAGMQLLAVGLAGSTCQVGTCLNSSGPASGHPRGLMSQAGHAFCCCFLTLLQQGKLRHRVIQCILSSGRGSGVCGWWGGGGVHAHGCGDPRKDTWGLMFLMLGVKGWADIALKDSVVEVPHLLELVPSHSLPVLAGTSTCLAHTPNPSPSAVTGLMEKALKPFSFKPSSGHRSGISAEPRGSDWPQKGPEDLLKQLVQKSCPAPKRLPTDELLAFPQHPHLSPGAAGREHRQLSPELQQNSAAVTTNSTKHIW